jgi:hypothetical protein
MPITSSALNPYSVYDIWVDTNGNVFGPNIFAIETGGDDDNGYRKFSDGYIEQWGLLNNTTTMTTASPDPGYYIRDIAIPFSVPFINTKYRGWGSSGSGICDAFSLTPNTVSSGYGYIWCAHSYGSRTIRWNARGRYA